MPAEREKPVSSLVRGSNENTNGLLRQFFRKRFDFSTVTEADLHAVADQLNAPDPANASSSQPRLTSSPSYCCDDRSNPSARFLRSGSVPDRLIDSYGRNHVLLALRHSGNLVASYDNEDEAMEAVAELAEDPEAEPNLLLMMFDDQGKLVADCAPGERLVIPA